MARWLSWVSDRKLTGWTCSECAWSSPLPTMLTNPEAKSAYDRLAAAKFEEHVCTQHGPRLAFGGEETFAERARKLVMRGFKPKDSVEIILQELSLEYRSDPKKLEQARLDAEDFLRKVKSGLI